MNPNNGNSDRLFVNNVRKVLELADIGLLSPSSYRFLTLHMGFIAHYDLDGFKNEYRDLRLFCRNLQTSEYGDDFDYNERWANESLAAAMRQLPSLDTWTIAYTIKDTVALAREYAPKINATFAAAQRERELAQARRIAEKYGYQLEEVRE